MDRAGSLSARRAWIEMRYRPTGHNSPSVALRKESVDRNWAKYGKKGNSGTVALRKESVDRNDTVQIIIIIVDVALRKESVDRNRGMNTISYTIVVALRKESVDRNTNFNPASLFDLRRSPQGERG